MGWYNASWSHRDNISIDHTKVPGDVTDFWVYIPFSQLSATAQATAQTLGGDFRITLGDGTTEVPIQVVPNRAGTAVNHVRCKVTGTTSSSTDTPLCVYYGNAGASGYGVTDTYGRNNVYTANSPDMVMDFEQDVTGSPAATDITGNGRDGTGTSMASGDWVDGKVGSAIDFDGSSNYLSVTDHASLDPGTGAFSVGAWIKPPNSNQAAPIFSKRAGGVPNIDFAVSGGNATGDYTSAKKLTVGIFESYGTNDYNASTTNDVADGNWHHMVWTRSGSTITCYVDASSVGITVNRTNGTGPACNPDNTAALQIGFGTYLASYLDALVDEPFYITGTALTANWITALYNNQNAPNTFFGTATAEAQPNRRRRLLFAA